MVLHDTAPCYAIKGTPRGTHIFRGNMKFTDRSIKSIRPTGKRFEVRETGRTGFAVRVSTTGTKTFVFIYKINGQKKRLSFGTYPAMSLNEAHLLYEEAKLELEKGNDPALIKAKKSQLEKNEVTIPELIKLYINQYAKVRKTSWEEDERQLNKDILPRWKNRKAIEINKSDVHAVLDTLIERGAPIGANRLLAVLKKVFNYAKEKGYVTNNPCDEITPPATETSRDRVLTANEIKTFWHQLDCTNMHSSTKNALKFQLITLQRRKEVALARWNDIHGDTWVIPAGTAKNKKRHDVHLSQFAKKLLIEAKSYSKDSPFLFPSPCGAGSKHIRPDALSKAVKRNMETLMVQDFSPHDLRRTAATFLTKSKIANRLVLSLMLNHSQGKSVTAVYDKYEYFTEQQKAWEAWGVKLEEIIA